MKKCLLITSLVLISIMWAYLLKPNKLLTKEFQPTLNLAVLNAMDELDHCHYFSLVYPNYFSKYIRWRTSKQDVSFGETSIKGICALSFEETQTILVNPDTILKPGCRSLKSTIAHEILHLADLPAHNFKDQINPTDREIYSDPIYDLERTCIR